MGERPRPDHRAENAPSRHASGITCCIAAGLIHAWRWFNADRKQASQLVDRPDRPPGRPRHPEPDRMPLSPPAPREMLHRRAIDIRGWRRDDGLYDIEAHLLDTKAYPFE